MGQVLDRVGGRWLDRGMRRRRFLEAGLLGVASAGLGGDRVPGREPGLAERGGFSLDGTRVRLRSRSIREEGRILMVADTHLFRDDQRGAPFIQFSGRMAAAYNRTRHHVTGAETHPEASFEAAMERAREWNAGLVALVGDIVSFPSESAVEWVLGRVRGSGRPFRYTAGNHDWHYEGMAGSLDALRQDWSRERLAPLHQGGDPLASRFELAGVEVLLIDNSTYEIQPSQLEFFRVAVRRGKPLVLMVHIPLYAPGRPLGFGCGHPDWNARNDRGHELERRERWRASGHTETTRTFHAEVFGAPNLLGVFAGHVHRPSLDLVNGVPQVVTEANAVGAWLEIELVPSGA